MPIQTLTARYFRNFCDLTLSPSPHLNIFFGQNAAGKTSLLEAIYYLSMGRSFRTRLISRIIQHQAQSFTLFAKIKSQEEFYIPIGLERTKEGERRLQVGGQLQTNQTVVLKHLPVLFISSNSYRYFYEGPKARRSFLDWGVFHVKPRFYLLWHSLQHILKQRNAGLRQGLSKIQLKPWDSEFISLSLQIDELRTEYVTELAAILDQLFLRFEATELSNLTLRYERGWSRDKSLEEVLASNLEQDLRLGYTQSGPQRADLKIYMGSIPAQDVLSQGQQKQVAYALYLAQGLLFKKIKEYSPIYLIDDLPAELDIEKRTDIAGILIELNAQVFITGIHEASFKELFNGPSFSMFHVKQGDIFQTN